MRSNFHNFFFFLSSVRIMVIFTESIMKPKNLIFIVGTKADLSGCMVKPILLKRLIVPVILFKQILVVSPIRKESSKYFTDRCPLNLKCLKGGNMTLGNSGTAGAKPLGSTVYLK